MTEHSRVAERRAGIERAKAAEEFRERLERAADLFFRSMPPESLGRTRTDFDPFDWAGKP